MVLVLHEAPGQRLIPVDNYSWNPLGISRAADRAATPEVLREARESWNVGVVVDDKDRFYQTYAGEAPGVL